MKATTKVRVGKWRLAAITACLAWLPGAFAQSPPLEIPFVNEWAASPHARMSAPAFNHWNADGEIPVACARCHSTPGFLDHIGADGTEPGVDKPAPLGTVISCVACHNEVTMTMDSVTFPSGLEVEDVGDDARCMTCHQGRQSTVSVNEALDGIEADAVSPDLRFINVHYRAAGATRFGTAAKGAYEYDGKAYSGFYTHDPDYQSCADCHEQHRTLVRYEECGACHKRPRVEGLKDLVKIRETKTDFDGDGDVKEGIGQEIQALQGMLYAAIQRYAMTVSGQAVAYDAHHYPYFFKDTDGNGKAEESEAVYPNQFRAWTPRLMRAAYNYQFSAKDPGSYTHNPMYIIQTLHDSLEDLSQKVSVEGLENLRRPQP